MEIKHFDIHSHIQVSQFDEDRERVLERMEDAGVGALVVGTDKESTEKALALAETRPYLWATAGLHPTDTATETFEDDVYKKFAANPKIVALGECGLDYYRRDMFVPEEKARQKDIFERHVEIAVVSGKPLMIHVRNAHEDMLDILSTKKKEYGDKLWGNIHFFSAGVPEAKRYFELDFTVSFTGVVTFTKDYDEVVRFAPQTHIMSETDCPFVAPVPYRGKRNESSYVTEVVKRLAEIRGEEFEAFRSALVANTQRVFALV